MNWMPQIILWLLGAKVDPETARILGFAWSVIFTFGVPYVAYRVITAPLRRQERERTFLDLLDACVRQGRSVEQALVSLAEGEVPPPRERVGSMVFGSPARPLLAAEEARRRQGTLGRPLQRLADHLSGGQTLVEALRRVRGIVPPRVVEMLRVGGEVGDLAKVLPACRATLSGATSAVRGAMNYLVVMASGFFFTSVFMLLGIVVLIQPRFADMLRDMRISVTASRFPWPGDAAWFVSEQSALILFYLFAGLGGLLILGAVGYVWGWGVLSFLGLDEVGSWLALLLPWRRKQTQRDFSAMLAILLDANVPEPTAVEMAAASTANRVFVRRATAVVAAMSRGEPLTEAIVRLDGSGELKWRLANALHAKTGFLAALAGWHESLEAKAFQQEQVAAQAITTLLVLANGAIVALLAAGIFQVLLVIMKAAAAW
jgi:type II secretory pathway component PulF